MFRIHLGDTKTTITDHDFKTLGELSDRYSGADIQIVVRDALMQPVRRVQKATHFMQVRKLIIVTRSTRPNRWSLFSRMVSVRPFVRKTKNAL